MWTTGRRAFSDVRIYNPFARRYSGLTLSQAYRANESEKKCLYNDRVMKVENGTFTPPVFSSAGGMAQECKIFIKQPSSLVADQKKRDILSSSILDQNQAIFCTPTLSNSLHQGYTQSLLQECSRRYK